MNFDQERAIPDYFSFHESLSVKPKEREGGIDGGRGREKETGGEKVKKTHNYFLFCTIKIFLHLQQPQLK